jgi:hypothetical protein
VRGHGGAASPAASAKRALELLRAPHSRLLRQHRCCLSRYLAASDSELPAALATAGGQDGTAGPGPHPLAEAVDLGPPAVVRLERALAHWSSSTSRETDKDQGRHVVRCAPRIRGRYRTWLSLFTVRAILPQVKPSRPGPSPDLEHRDFHNGPAVGDLGCGKSASAGRLTGPAAAMGMGKPHRSARTHLVDEPVDNELRSVVDGVERNAARARGKARGAQR